MKLKFDPTLSYQLDAIDSTVQVFDGQPSQLLSSFELHGMGQDGLAFSELGIGNQILLSDDQFLENVRRIQSKNHLERVSELQGRNFSIEMETGTGKTYVYLRSIFELNKVYGFTKFIIVVPSIPIREGVLKSLDIMREHFKTLYDNVPFDYFVYDPKKLGKIRQFAVSNQIQVMVINIQSFQRDVMDSDSGKGNVIYRENDKMSGWRPIDFINATNPIVIIDEPQSVDNTETSKKAISRLNPSAVLRYSATHRNPYNLIYSLDPIRAYDLRLVKRIEVASVAADADFSESYVKLISATNTSNVIKAKLEIYKDGPTGPKKATVTVKQNDDLGEKSGGHPSYQQGHIIRHIDCTPGQEYVEFNTGKFVQLGAALGGQDDAIFQKMIFETVEQHFQKERALKAKGIKVLSLLFVDHVSSYRIYQEDGSTRLGKFAEYFEAAFKEIGQRPIYKDLVPYEVSKVHNGYFSQDKKSGQFKDSNEGRDSKDDEDTYNLIMRDKERLLDPEEPLRFIFSHTALREGWDNPNIFQICTLREVGTDIQRRQQIGRGLRLPVNVNGERVKDETINRLTVISNENYREFAKHLQTEYESDFGIQFGKIKQNAFVGLVYQNDDGETSHTSSDRSEQIWQAIRQAGYINQQGDLQSSFAPNDLTFQFMLPEEFQGQKSSILTTMKKFMIEERIGNAKERRGIAFNKRVQLSDDFQELWKRISQKTRYRVTYQTNELIANAASRIYSMEKIPQLKITVEKVELDINQAGVRGDHLLSQKITTAPEIKVLPDILAFLQKETELTRHTLVEILKASKRLDDFKINPQLFMDRVAKEIQSALYELMLKGIQYEKIAGQYWEMQRLEEDFDKGLTRYLKDLYAVQNPDKSIYDFVEFDSDVEKEFARQLDMNVNIKLFVKLPSWFKIDTPIGPYNPDWAFVTEREEKLYFVRETKSTHDSDDRRTKENHKIQCGKRHFDSLGVDYGVVTSLAEVNF